MRIGINCLAVNPTYRGGVNTFIFGLLRGLSEQAGQHQIVLFTTPGNSEHFRSFTEFPNFTIAEWNRDSIRGLGVRAVMRAMVRLNWSRGNEWVSDVGFGSLAKWMDDQVDWHYVPTVVLRPYGCRKPTLLSMHDIQHAHFPEHFDARELRWRNMVYSISARRTSYLQASSEFIRQDLLEHFPFLRPDQIVVIREGVDVATFASEPTVDVAAEYGLPPMFAFYPAQLWHHKNHLTVLRALKRLEREGLRIPLVLTGAKFSAAGEILRFIESEGMDYVRYLGKVPLPHLIALYRTASLFITATLYESSSLPVLEAAAGGMPLLASDTPPNREASENLAIELFAPKDDEALALKLRSFWENPAAARALAVGNKERVKQFDWSKIAQQYLRFFETHS